MEKNFDPICVREAQPLEGFMVRIKFDNGVQRDVDLEPYLDGPIFEPIRNDHRLFCAMKIEGGTIAWENGADIDSIVLYHNLKPAWMEAEFSQQDTGR